MSIIPLAFQALFDRECPYQTELKYSGKFKGYNANCKLSHGTLSFNLSNEWEEVGDEIKIGLIQELLVKMFKKRYKWKRKNTVNMELYEIFLKKVHLTIPKTKIDPILNEAFNRVNDRYLYSALHKPNMVWGSYATTQLGSYDYGTDTIKISKMLHPETAPQFVLDYVMYHEMLHKKLQFKSNCGRTRTHTKEFKEREREFENYQLAEKILGKLPRKPKTFLQAIFR